MISKFRHIITALALVGLVQSGAAYSLLLKGYDDWQTAELGYQLVLDGDDIAGPANQFLGEEYRWNAKTIYYGYDISFLNYFGAHGTNAVGQAFGILNAIPAASQISSNLAEYPMDTMRMNYAAGALGLLDLKSVILGVMLEQSGLGSPERWAWCLYNRTILTNPDRTNYTVIKRNYDPVTRDVSSHVNGVLYTYVIQELQNPNFSDAVEVQVDPLQIGFTAVASYMRPGPIVAPNFYLGSYYTGLTRDDIGGWKRLYENSTTLNQNHFETLPTGTTAGAVQSPWNPGTNTTATTIVDGAIRSGVDKVEFKTGNYDSYLGVYVATITNAWDDYYRSGMFAPLFVQRVQRAIATPDIILVADYLPNDADGNPAVSERTDTGNWVNNSVSNGIAGGAGPGTIQGPITITLNTVGPFYINQNPFLLDEMRQASTGFSWGSFDGTTNNPIVYPTWASIDQLRMQVIYGAGSPWTIPDSTATTNAGTVGGAAAGGGGQGGGQ